MPKEKRNVKQAGKIKTSPFKDYWNKYNYYTLYLGIGILIVGYFLMSQGPWDNPISRSISPIIILVAYLIVIPLSIIFKLPKRFRRETDVSGKN